MTTTTTIQYLLKLFVAGQSPTSQRARNNLQIICDTHLVGRHQLTIIDVTQRPELAELERILATPMLVRESPLPVRRIIGDLSDRDMVLATLDLLSVAPGASMAPGNPGSRGGRGGNGP